MINHEQNVYNFSAGPTALPTSVLENAQQELTNFQGTRMSVMELSHRSETYEKIHNEAIERIKNLYNVSEDYRVLFLQGGASLQFSMIPMNFLTKNQKAGYIMTGSWSEKAFAEAPLFGNAYEVASSKDDEYRHIPQIDTLTFNEDDAYVHLTTNNTIYGTQWHHYPDTGSVPLIADMSSDIMSRPINVDQFNLIYAGAQKNLGPSGVTVVIIHKDLLEKANENVPTALQYKTHAKSNSLYNTPPTFSIYMLGEVMKWIELQGGLKSVQHNNEEKAKHIYDVIDNSDDFYVGHAKKESRSLMNITFNLQSEQLEKQFLTEAAEQGFVGLNGHRSVGGCRASTYNAVPEEACLALSEFMKEFKNKHS